jgi:hypothetical protein
MSSPNSTPTTDTWRLQTDVTWEVFLDFQRAYLAQYRARHPYARALRWGPGVVGSLVVGAMFLSSGPGWALAVTAAGFAWYWIALWAEDRWYLPWQWRRLYRPAAAQGLYGSQTLTMTPQEVRMQTAHTDGVVRWDAVSEIVETPSLILLYMGPQMAVIIPRATVVEAFGSQGAAEWLSQVRHWQAHSQSAGAARLS